MQGGKSPGGILSDLFENKSRGDVLLGEGDVEMGLGCNRAGTLKWDYWDVTALKGLRLYPSSPSTQ